MSVRAVMTENIDAVGSTDTVATAAKRMADNEHGALLVIDGGVLNGVFTERDLLRRVVAAGKDPARTKVGEVATKQVVTVPVTASLRDCYERMKQGGFRHLPVVDDSGALLGIVASRDLFRFMAIHMEPMIDMQEFYANVAKLQIEIVQELRL